MTTASQTPAANTPARKKKKHRGRKLLIALIILLLLGGAGAYTYFQLRAEYHVTYDGYTATRGTISNSLSYTGSMQLIDNASYSASEKAKVREAYVSVGDRVREGDKLVRLSNGTTFTADFDGQVEKVEVEKGDEVASGSLLVQVTDYDHMKVSFRIGESDISDVTTGLPCRVTVASIGKTFEGNVTTIDHSSYSGNNVAYYTATVELDTSAVDNIYPGMQATIVIPQEEASNVVVLKMDAVSTARDNTAFVYKQQADGTMAEVPVSVGVSNGNYVEIKTGVAEGETVYAVAKQTDAASAWSSMMSGMFGSQQVNAPMNMPGGGGTRRNWTNNNGGGSGRGN